MIPTILKRATQLAGVGAATALLASLAFAQAPSTSTNKDVPEHGTASSKTPAQAAPMAPGATRSGQRLPPTTSAKHGGTTHGTAQRSPKNAKPKMGNTGMKRGQRLPSTSTNKAVPEHGTSTPGPQRQ